MLWAQEKISIMKRFAGEIGQSRGSYLEDGLPLKGRGRDAVAGKLTIDGIIGAERQGILVDERRRRHRAIATNQLNAPVFAILNLGWRALQNFKLR